MKNYALLAVAALVALVLGAGVSFGTRTAQADVDDSVAIGCEFLAAAIDGDDADETSGADFAAACDVNGLDATDVANLANTLGDADDVLEASDFADVDLDANQVQDGAAGPFAYAASIYIIAFVDDDEKVTFDAGTGLSIAVNDDDALTVPVPDGNAETCAPGELLDLDCETSVAGDGDGVVVATATESGADDAEIDVDISQADNASAVSSQTITIQGPADEVSVVAAEEVIGTSDDVAACENELDVTDATDQLGDLEKTVVIATVVDSDGDALARIPLLIEDDDAAIALDDDDATEEGADADAIANPNSWTTATVDAGDVGIAGFAVVCGDEDPGEGIVTVTINDGTAGEESADVTITVAGAPANVALTASPAAINCDGTASATVSATVTDADGNNVVDGTNVNFSVVALGIASPINADTTDGVASSTITPLSAGVAGVTVVVSSGDASASIRVDCNPAAAPTAGPGASPTPPGGVIGGPDTGSGGYLGQDSSAGFPMWTLVALTLGAVALAAGGMVTKKVTR